MESNKILIGLIESWFASYQNEVVDEPKIIELPNNRVDLVFEIREGAKTGVKDIKFVGNKSFSHGRLKDVIKTSESNFLSFLRRSIGQKAPTDTSRVLAAV